MFKSAGGDFTKVLLINPISDYVKEKAAIPLGLLSIATYLTRNGVAVQIYDRAVEGGSIKKRIRSFSPDIVGVSSLGARSFDDAMKVSKVAKKNNIPVVWGGQIPSLVPELLLKSGFVDYVIMGDGEMAMFELVNAVGCGGALCEIDGLAFIENGEPILTKPREPVDLLLLPVINFTFVDPARYFISSLHYKKMLFLYASKGCTGQCKFCYNSGTYGCDWRARPMEYVLSEIRFLIENFELDGVYFGDDLISPNRKYLVDFCGKIVESGLKFVWNCNMRADVCTREDLQMMYDAGCRWIFFGVESGSERRQRAIGKNMNLKKVKQAVDDCDEIGIITTTSFVIGFPDETEEELKTTVSFIKELNSDVKIPSYFGPIPKSKMYLELVANKKIEVPTTYKEWDKLFFMDTFGKNFSQVPGIDLKVISNYFFLKILTQKTKNNDVKSQAWGKRLLGQTFGVLKTGTAKSLCLVFLAAKQFLGILFYALLFPKIRRKYGLTFNSKDKTKSRVRNGLL